MMIKLLLNFISKIIEKYDGVIIGGFCDFYFLLCMLYM